jgi:hypothetical protein
MIRIKLIKEGRVVKQISSRLHESVILEQLKNYNEVVDEIVYEGELSEGAEEILRKVAKKVIPAAMAAGIALGGASTAKAQNYFPGTDRSVGQHIADIFSPNYREIQRQRQAERNTRQREFDAYHREVERGRVQAARDAGRRQTGQMSGSAMPSNVKVYDQARISADGKSIILYDMNHQVTRLPRTGTDFVAGDSQRLSHYIRGSQVYYVRHAAVRESIEEINEDPTVGTIPAAGGPITTKKPIGSTGTRPTASSAVANNQAAKAAAAGAEDQEDDKEDLAALRKAGQMLSGIKEEVESVDEAEEIDEAKSLRKNVNYIGQTVQHKDTKKLGVVSNSYTDGSHSIKWHGEKTPTKHDWYETKNKIRLAEDTMSVKDANKLQDKHSSAAQRARNAGDKKAYDAHMQHAASIEDKVIQSRSGSTIAGKSLKAKSEKIFKDYPYGIKEEVEEATDPLKARERLTRHITKDEKSKEIAHKHLKSMIKATKGTHPKPSLPEEAEQVDEISKKTVASYSAKAGK